MCKLCETFWSLAPLVNKKMDTCCSNYKRLFPVALKAVLVYFLLNFSLLKIIMCYAGELHGLSILKGFVVQFSNSSVELVVHPLTLTCQDRSITYVNTLASEVHAYIFLLFQSRKILHNLKWQKINDNKNGCLQLSEGYICSLLLCLTKSA